MNFGFFKIRAVFIPTWPYITAAERAMPIRLSMPTGTLSEEPIQTNSG